MHSFIQNRLVGHLLVSAMWVLSSVNVRATHPEPGNIYYGLVRNDAGVAYTADSQGTVVMRVIRGGQSIIVATAAVIGTGSGAFNYVLRVPLDDGTPPLYSPTAAVPGDQPRLALAISGQEMPLSGDIPAIGGRGTITEVALSTACADSDHDGLCDEWEMTFFKSLSGPRQGPNEDYDGDGFSNLREQRAGTDPTNKESHPPIETGPELVVISYTTDRVNLQWTAKSGKSYRFEYATDWTSGFQPIPDSRVVAGNPVGIIVTGLPVVFIRLVEQ